MSDYVKGIPTKSGNKPLFPPDAENGTLWGKEDGEWKPVPIPAGKGAVRYDTYQNLSWQEQVRARFNIGAVSAEDAQNYGKPVFVTITGDDPENMQADLPFADICELTQAGRQVVLEYGAERFPYLVAETPDMLVFSGGLSDSLRRQYILLSEWTDTIAHAQLSVTELVAGTETLGGVKADPATDTDTTPVRIDSDGYLWTGATGGATGNPPAITVPAPPPGVVVSACQSKSEWVATTLGSWVATIEDDPNDFLLGNQSVKFTNCIQKWNVNANTEGKQFRIRFKINSIDAGAGLLLYVSDDNSFTHFSSFEIYNPAASDNHDSIKIGEWCDMVLPWSALQDQGTLRYLKTVGLLRFRFLNGGGSANIQMVALVDAPKGIVSFTFDDGLVTQYTEAARILGMRNIPATAYIIPNLVGVNSGAMTEEQVISLRRDYNWDIEAHWGDVMTEMSEKEIDNALLYTKDWIQSRGLGRGDHFAYPGGAHNQKLKDACRKYFSTARTIDNNKLKGIDSDPVGDPYALRAVSGIGNNPGGHSVADTKAEITRVANNGGWLLLVFHSIGSTATNMYCTAAGLAEIADHAIASGVEIKTVADAIAGFACGGG